METTNSINENKHKLLSQSWDLNSSGFLNQLFFRWQGNEVLIDIKAYLSPTGRDKHIHFDFYLNGKPTHFEFKYNPYGGSPFGKTPELESGGYRLTFFASPKFFEIYEQKLSVRKEEISHE